MEEDIHNEFKKHIGAACISYNAEQSLLVVLVSIVCFSLPHYENLPMQYTEIFLAVKIENFIRKMLIFFLFLLKT